MTLTELKYIVMLSKEQHFGRAAERCFVSQPTLSIAVKKLEEELGVALFERTKNRVRATPIGERVISQAQHIIEQTGTIRDIATEGKDQLNNPLSVGAIFTIGPYLFPHMIPQLHKIAPEMPLIIEESYTATLRQRLRNGELDVIIVSLPFTEADVVTQTLYEEPFVVVVPKEHALAKRKVIKSKHLEKENMLLLGEGHCFRDQILDSCPSLRMPADEGAARITTAAEGSSLETLCHMVATGLGVTVLPMSATLSNRYSDLKSIPFDKPVPTRSVALAWRASFPRHKAIDALRQSIQQCGIEF